MAKKKKTSMDAPMTNEEWEVESDLRAIARATSVKKDPERMKKVKAMAAKMLEENKRKKDEAQQLIDLGQGEAID